MAAHKKGGIDPALIKAVGDLLKEVMTKPKAGEEAKYSLTDKMRVLDRSLKLEAIKQKMTDEGYGSGFFAGDADDKNGG